MELLRLILATQIERDWSLDALDAKEVFLALRSDAGGDALLSEAVEAVLGRFSRPALDRGPNTYAIDSRRVARFLAEQIFASEGSRPWPVSEFLAALQATMPPQLQLDDIGDLENWRSKAIPQSLVRDMAYVSTPIDSQQLFTPSGVSAESTLLNPLSRSALPHEPRARMRHMFEARSRWTAAELQPFFEDLVDVDDMLLESGDVQAQTTVKKAVDSWLLKFGRGVKGAGSEVVYSSRIN
ncbi:hypothetical protein COEREDRAFT_79983 [Coemansia reversa NRRL 1564]|uniref:Sister chromatid cohesion protein Dcc1 n=1 Tax=Coemansia reversa (strain ATCC 12441 / NRRL 1564) TaxID=763665 RepID=A0A2G5BG85_COERN|nr:hypothetical protein COEREDRAFT_79983 [Coemansia reversa NRRL 1564]|eukprot:PIA18036.1 hypothetical protein COEREDRAFT_79983 [Coemansia reversa NRRL 1564]